ncbi:MAG: YraN family protein [Cyclobacteriaceae bacterium]
MDRKIIGENGEKQAFDYLVAKGYEVLEQNYRYRKAEIDLICLYRDTLIFVEVKKRRNNEYGYPEDFVSNAQKRLIMNASDHYIHAINWQRNIRYDIIAITGSELLHLEDVFY